MLAPVRVRVPLPPAPLTVRPAVPPMAAPLVMPKVAASMVLLLLRVTVMAESMRVPLVPALSVPPLRITWFVA